MRSKNWVFTVNNPTGLLFPELDGWEQLGCTFLVYQEEVGEEGTYHLQGYLELKNRKTLRKVKELPGLERAHLEARRGTQTEAVDYASKSDSQISGPYQWGKASDSQQGRRNDLLDVKKRIDAGGATLTNLFGDHFGPVVRYGRGISTYLRLKTPPRDFESIVFLFVGPSGKGKSTLARLIAKQLGTVYFVPDRKGSGLYFDDYDYQDVLFFDEFDGSVMPPTSFNQLCQPFSYILPCHGAAGAQMRSRYIFICSNYLPASWWKNRSGDQIYQTTRRIHATVPLLCSPSDWARRRATHKRPNAPHPPKAVVHGPQGQFLYDVGQNVPAADAVAVSRSNLLEF